MVDTSQTLLPPCASPGTTSLSATFEAAVRRQHKQQSPIFLRSEDQVRRGSAVVVITVKEKTFFKVL
jgi:hypothetical protein